jgi:hypothetical protein
MQIQSKALPQSFSLRRLFLAPAVGQSEKSHTLLIFTAAVLLTLFVMVEVDLHAAQLQAIGLLGHATGIDPIFMGP